MGVRKPAVLGGTFVNCDVRFHYETKDGADAYVSGRLEEFLGNEEKGITGIRVRLNVSARYPGLNAYETVACKLDRITPNAETGLIVPVSKKELATGTGAAQFILSTSKQVDYAVSLAAQVPDSMERPAEKQFRAMSRHDLSEWIDMAKFEIQNAKDA
jgi:hypothetical protein